MKKLSKKEIIYFYGSFFYYSHSLSKRDGLKYKEIGDKLNISAKTVENQVAKAMRIIKEGAIKIYYFFFG